MGIANPAERRGLGWLGLMSICNPHGVCLSGYLGPSSPYWVVQVSLVLTNQIPSDLMLCCNGNELLSELMTKWMGSRKPLQF